MRLKAPRKYRDRRSLKTLDPAYFLPHPVVPTVMLEEVDGFGGGVLIWVFSADLVLPLPANALSLQAREIHSPTWVTPDSIELFDTAILQVNYSGVDFDTGYAWRVLSPPPGLLFAGGQTLVVPQSG